MSLFHISILEITAKCPLRALQSNLSKQTEDFNGTFSKHFLQFFSFFLKVIIEGGTVHLYRKPLPDAPTAEGAQPWRVKAQCPPSISLHHLFSNKHKAELYLGTCDGGWWRIM